MSLEKEKILLESKINRLKKDRELKKMEGEMFVTQAREELSPYLDFTDIDINKAKLAVENISRIAQNISDIENDIKALERKLR